MSSVMLAPGATALGSATAITVRSSALSSSGWMKRMAPVRSAPPSICMCRTSIQPQPSLASRSPRNSPPDSRMNVLFSLANAFR